MRVLVTAYCCAPDSGSEQAFGWWWVTTCAADHDVTVITPAAQRQQIEARIGDGLPGLRFEYVGGARKVSSSGMGYRFERIQQYVWQLCAIRRVRLVARRERPDVAQHLTTGTWRVPSPLSFTDVPYIVGPLAGSERVPPGLFRTLGARGVIQERARLVQMGIARLDPLVRRTLRRAEVILAAGPMTHDDLSARYPGKTELGTRAFAHASIDRSSGSGPDAPGTPPRLCWVGRLVPGKGLDLLLTALADDRLRAVELDVVGNGPDRARLAELADHLGVASRVTFHGHLPQQEAFALIRGSHAFVFTSYRELMGQALSEAMQVGAACIILDWSGPSVLAGNDGALKVPVSDFAGTVAALTEAIVSVVTDPIRRQQLRRAARARIDSLIEPERSSAARDAVFERAISAARL